MTKPRYVYLLSQRDAHRADWIECTTARARLPDLLAAAKPKGERFDRKEAQATLAKLLGFSDEHLAMSVGHQLTGNLASVQLHVVRVA